MFPERRMLNKSQRGSAIVIALFIIVVMSLLVASLSQLLRSSSESVSYEVLGTRAFYAAQTGLEAGLVQLFPVNSSSSTYCEIGVDGRSPANPADELGGRIVAGTAGVAADNVSPETAALAGCTYKLSCQSGRKTNQPEEVQYFLLRSTGECVSGDIRSQRTVGIEVWR